MMLKNMVLQLIGLNVAVYGINSGNTVIGLLGIAFMGTFLIEFTIASRKLNKELDAQMRDRRNRD